MSPHVTESVMRNIKSALEGIINIGTPIAAVGNSTPADSFIVETSGSCTHTAKTTYEIAISEAGISGVAKCTITDKTDGTDTVATAQVITSGADINIGTRGGKIRFTFDAGTSLVIGDKWTVVTDTYNHTMKAVYRAKAVGVALNSFPSTTIASSTTDYGGANSDSYSPKMTVDVEEWIEERDETTIDQVLIEAKQDLEKVLQADPSWGGYASDTVLKRSDAGVPLRGSPYGVISMQIEVSYNQSFHI